MKLLIPVLMFMFALTFGNALAALEVPPSPLPLSQSVDYGLYDVQIHSRDMNGSMEQMYAEHDQLCNAPPTTHFLAGTARAAAAFICNGHIMTALHEGGYGAIAITPTKQIVGTTATITWSMSTETQSSRDWVDIWITPWNENITLPADIGAVDLQGVPRNAIHIKDNVGPWCVRTIRDYVETDYIYCGAFSNSDIHLGIAPGTNEAATRQNFRIMVTPTTLRFERLASATASGVVYYDGPADVPNVDGAIVQFMHHSYNPEKDSACASFIASNGYCGPTWHWQNMDCSPCIPFTLIRPNITEIYNNGVPQTISFPPAPANAYLRFTGLGGIVVNGQLAPKKASLNGAGHGAPYFIPLQQGATSATISFQTDDWYNTGFGMSVQDIAIWAQGGSAPQPTPTPTTVVPTPTNTPIIQPTATNTPIVQPTATRTPVPPTPTATPSAQTQVCTVRWGSSTVNNLGQLTQAQCSSIGR